MYVLLFNIYIIYLNLSNCRLSPGSDVANVVNILHTLLSSHLSNANSIAPSGRRGLNRCKRPMRQYTAATYNILYSIDI